MTVAMTRREDRRTRWHHVVMPQMRPDAPAADVDHLPRVPLRSGVVADLDLVLVLRSTRPAVRERGTAEYPERHEQQTRHDRGADEPTVCSSKQSLHPATSRVAVLGS